nr:PREDICTED: mucin-4-like [Bemisia tabaci]
MTVFMIIFTVLIVSVIKYVPVSTYPVSSSLNDGNVEADIEDPNARKLVFYPLPVVVPASEVDNVLHKDPEELQHILADKAENPFMPSHLPQDAFEMMSDILKHPVMMELDPENEDSADLFQDQANPKEDQPVTPEPEESVTYFTDELGALRPSTVSHDLKEQTQAPKNISRKPPVKLLQRLLRDYLPVVNPEVKNSTPPEKNPVISSLAKKTLKPAPSMKYPVFGNGQFFSLLNTLNVILNRKNLPPSKTYEPFKVPEYNVSFPKFTVNVSETLLEPPAFASNKGLRVSSPKPDCADELHGPANTVSLDSMETEHNESSIDTHSESVIHTPHDTDISHQSALYNENKLGYYGTTKAPSDNHWFLSTHSSLLNFEMSSSPIVHENDLSSNQDDIIFKEPDLPDQPHLSSIHENAMTETTLNLADQSTQSPSPVDPSSLEPVSESSIHYPTANKEDNLNLESSSAGHHSTYTDLTTPSEKVSAVTPDYLVNSHNPDDMTTPQQRPEFDFMFNPGANTPAPPEFLNVESVSEPHETDTSISHDESSHEPMSHTDNHVSSSDHPTNAPTNAPTDAPTDALTDALTDAPTDVLTDAPTDVLTDAPTDVLTDAPTDALTDAPTDAPTDALTNAPTDAPTKAPTTFGEETQFESTSNFDETSDLDTTEKATESTVELIVGAQDDQNELQTTTAPTKKETGFEKHQSVNITTDLRPTTDQYSFENSSDMLQNIEHATTENDSDLSESIAILTTLVSEPEAPDRVSDSTSGLSHFESTNRISETTEYTTLLSVSDSFSTKFTDFDETTIEALGTSKEHESSTQIFDESITTTDEIIESDGQFSNDKVDSDTTLQSDVGDTSVTVHSFHDRSWYSTQKTVSAIDDTLSTVSELASTDGTLHHPDPSIIQEDLQFSALSSQGSEESTPVISTQKENLVPETLTPEIAPATEVPSKDEQQTTEPSSSVTPNRPATSQLFAEITEEVPNLESTIIPEGVTETKLSTDFTEAPTIAVDASVIGSDPTESTFFTTQKDATQLTTSPSTFKQPDHFTSDTTVFDEEVFTTTMNYEPPIETSTPEIASGTEIPSKDAQQTTEPFSSVTPNPPATSQLFEETTDEVPNLESTIRPEVYTDTDKDTSLSEYLGLLSLLDEDQAMIAVLNASYLADQPEGPVVSENVQSETTIAPQETTTESSLSPDDLITSTMSPMTAAPAETADEGATPGLFLGNQVTEEESTVLPPANTQPPVGDHTTTQTEISFTDPEEEEIEDPFDCETEPCQQETTPGASISSTTPKNKTTRLEGDAATTKDDKIVFQEIDYPTISAKVDDLAGTTSTEETSRRAPSSYLVNELDVENFPVVQDLRALPEASKKKAEKLLDLLSGELFIEGADWEDNENSEENYEVDGSGMKIIKSGQRKGKWIENLSNDQLMALIESVREKHGKS